MTTMYVQAIENEATAIEIASALLREGMVVAIPTETVYGLAAIITNDDAIRRIFSAKGRPSDNPLIVHVATMADVASVAIVSTLAQRLMEAFFPGALTLVLPKLPHVSNLVTAGLSTVAVRMPGLALTRAIIEATGTPVAAPSANRSGRPSPTMAEHVIADLDGAIAAVIDAGPCRDGLESTVVRVVDEQLFLLRPGSVRRADIERAVGVPVQDVPTTADLQRSPGTRYRHYAPSAQVVLVRSAEDALHARDENQDPAILLAPSDLALGIPWRPLSSASLYAELRRADSLHVKKIIVHCDEQVQTNEALMNRLQKAAEPSTDD
ncbi:L-threonylcarbamoyladenylate synthase [soil metagenome]